MKPSARIEEALKQIEIVEDDAELEEPWLSNTQDAKAALLELNEAYLRPREQEGSDS